MLANKEILIAKYLSGNATSEEVKKVNDWLKQDPSNQTEFNGIEKLWNTSMNLKKDGDADVEKAWAEFKSLTEKQPEIVREKRNVNWLNIAAAVSLFLVTSAVVRFFHTESSQIPRSEIVNVDFKTPTESEQLSESAQDMSSVVFDSSNVEVPSKSVAKQTKQINLTSGSSIAMITVSAGDSAQIFMLPDNSIVYLNAKSKLEYPQNFNKTNRRVSLTGEAYFEVKKDSGQFVVACENTIIRGKGTSFNVKSHSMDKEVEVIVASGMVEFSGVGYKDFKKLVLNTGESGYYNKAKSVIIKSKHQRRNYKWWQKKSLRAKIKDFFDRLMGKKH